MNLLLRLLVLKTDAVERAVAFYELLGFEFTEECHGKGPLHHSAKLGEAVLEIYPLTEGHSPDASTRLGFGVGDPKSVVAAVELAGGTVISPGRETSWGFIALVADPDGRIVELYPV